MSAFSVEITRDALKTLAQLDKTIRRRLEAAIDKLCENPRPAGVVAVKSLPGCLRIRVGDYRVIYEVQDHKLVVLIVEVGHRSEVYR